MLYYFSDIFFSKTHYTGGFMDNVRLKRSSQRYKKKGLNFVLDKIEKGSIVDFGCDEVVWYYFLDMQKRRT